MRASRERGVTARVSYERGERAGATVSPPMHEPADPTLESPSPRARPFDVPPPLFKLVSVARRRRSASRTREPDARSAVSAKPGAGRCEAAVARSAVSASASVSDAVARSAAKSTEKAQIQSSRLLDVTASLRDD